MKKYSIRTQYPLTLTLTPTLTPTHTRTIRAQSPSHPQTHSFTFTRYSWKPARTHAPRTHTNIRAHICHSGGRCPSRVRYESSAIPLYHPTIISTISPLTTHHLPSHLAIEPRHPPHPGIQASDYCTCTTPPCPCAARSTTHHRHRHCGDITPPLRSSPASAPRRILCPTRSSP